MILNQVDFPYFDIKSKKSPAIFLPLFLLEYHYMERKNTKTSQGFALIGLLITVAIIAILFVMYFKNSGGKPNQTPIQTKKEAEQDLNISNEKLNDYQKQLNSQ